MNQQELKSWFEEKTNTRPNNILTAVNRFEKYKSIKENLIQYTNFLPNDAKLNERVFCLLNDIKRRPKCLECNKETKYDRLKRKYRPFCSSKCSNNSQSVKHKKEQTSIKHYGTKNPRQSNVVKEKYRKTVLKKYGTEHYSSTEEFKKKYKNTCLERYGEPTTATLKNVIDKRYKTNLERYGVKHPMHSEIVKNKIKNTCLKKYGVEYYYQTEEFKKKSNNTCLEKYGDTNFARSLVSDESLEKLNDKEWLIQKHHNEKMSILELSKLLNVSDGTVGRYFRNHEIEIRITGTSQGEKEIAQYISDLGIKNVQTNVRGIIDGRFELDIFLPDHNLAIEFCGLYWHSEVFKDKNYHLNKLKLCEKEGIRLIHIYENEWNNNSLMIKNKIKYFLQMQHIDRIYARKCIVDSIDKNTKKKFLNKYHIQGNCNSSIDIGIYYKNKLIGVMSFKNQKNGNFVMERYATSTSVVGGFSKLLSWFKKNYDWEEIITFADRRWSQGDLYLKNGFMLDKTLPPDYKYVKGFDLYHKFNFRHCHMKNKLENYDPMLTEKENMKNHGFHRIYDCGLLRFKMKKGN